MVANDNDVMGRLAMISSSFSLISQFFYLSFIQIMEMYIIWALTTRYYEENPQFSELETRENYLSPRLGELPAEGVDVATERLRQLVLGRTHRIWQQYNNDTRA